MKSAFFYCICRHFTRWTLTAIPKLHYKANIPEMFMSIYLFIIKLIAHAFWLQGMYHDTILQQCSATRHYENRIIFVPLSVLTLLVKSPDPPVWHTRDAHHFRDAAESRHHFSERFPAFLHTDQDWGLHPRTLCKKVTQPHSLLTPLSPLYSSLPLFTPLYPSLPPFSHLPYCTPFTNQLSQN